MPTMKEQPLVLVGLSGDATIDVTPDFKKRRATALKLAVDVKEVGGPTQQQFAVGVISDLKGLRLAVEATRRMVKEPVLELGRKIDALAKTAVADILIEEERLMKLATSYADKVAEQERAAQAQRDAELKAVRDEEERLEREAEAAAEAKRAAERKAEEAKGRAKAKAQRDADAAAEASRASDEAAETARREREGVAEQQSIIPTPEKAVGASVRAVWDFEVVNVAAFARDFPALVMIEVRRAETLKAIAALHQEGRATVMTGLRITSRTKLSVR